MKEFLSLFIGILLLIGYGILYGKLMNFFGIRIHKFVQTIKNIFRQKK